MKRLLMLLLLIGLVLVSLMMVTRVYGQDDDGDGLPNDVDHCPNVAGPRENSGCPVGNEEKGNENTNPANVGPPSGPDSDSDGISDRIDLCPQDYGPPDTGGCPPEEPISVQPVLFTPLLIAADAPCSVAAKYAEGANVRAFVSLEAPIIGGIDSKHIYAVQAAYLKQNDLWYLLVEPAGFVLSDVVSLGGRCENLIPICVFVGPSPDSETQQAGAEAGAAPPLVLSVMDAEAVSAENAQCEAGNEIPPTSDEPQLGTFDDTPGWPLECYLGLMDGLAIGTSVATTQMTGPGPINVYHSPFDEDPFDMVGSLYYGSITDGPACRDRVIMWKVTLKSENVGETVVGWVQHIYLFPVPD